MYKNILNYRIANNLVFKDHYLVYMAFFFLGFGKFVYYLPLFLLYFFLKMPVLFSVKINKQFLILLFLMLMSVLPIYTIGIENFNIDNPFRNFIYLLFSFIMAGFILQYESQDVRFWVVSSYILGLGFGALIVTGYSFITDPVKYGYGRLIDPFSNLEINSPGISNNLAIFMTLLIYFLITAKNILWKVIVFLMMGVTLAAAVFLGGRTFFVILIISLFLLLLRNLSMLKLTKVSFGVFVVGFLVFYVLVNNEYFLAYLKFMLSRFENGLESKRFGHYAHGLSQTVYYPLGGFTVDKGFEDTKWFHNIFLDNASLAGWLPVLFLLFTMSYITVSCFKQKDDYFIFGFLFFAVSVLIMMIDVVIEGNSKPLVLMYFAGIMLVVKRRKKLYEVRRN